MKTTDQELTKLAVNYISKLPNSKPTTLSEAFWDGYRQAESNIEAKIEQTRTDTLNKVLVLLRGRDAIEKDFNSRPYGICPDDWAEWIESKWKQEK
jgi:hypothetical protein